MISQYTPAQMYQWLKYQNTVITYELVNGNCNNGNIN